MKRRTFLFLPLALLPAAVLAQADPPTVAAIGDSITIGYGASAPGLSYISCVLAALGWSVDNRAIGASTIVDQQASIQATSAPITIWLTGYNDMRVGTDLNTYAAQLADAIDLLAASGRVLYLGNCLRMPPASYRAFGAPWDQGSDALVAAYNARIAAAVAAAQQAGRAAYLVDASATYDPATMCGPDLVHPNDAGHAAIAQAFLGVIRRRVLLPVIGGYPAP